MGSTLSPSSFDTKAPLISDDYDVQILDRRVISGTVEVVGISSCYQASRDQLLRLAIKVAAEYGRLPDSLSLIDVKLTGPNPLARSALGDEYLGTYGKKKVVLKCLRKLEINKGNYEKARNCYFIS